MIRKEHRAGFTLVELLVVVGIISVLAAILFVVGGPVRKMARVTTCTSHLHQIGLAYKLYLSDYDDHYPDSLAMVHSAYIGDQRILFCPDDTTIAVHGAISSYTWHDWIPPDFSPLVLHNDIGPSTVLVDCDNHTGERWEGSRQPGQPPPPLTYMHHLVLRADGSVHRIHINQIKHVLMPGTRFFARVYPGDPGYDEAVSIVIK